MLTDKELEKKYSVEFKKNPSIYPINGLKELGYTRNQCKKCKVFFWDTDPKRNVCGDNSCMGGYTFMDTKITKNKIDYIKLWQYFSKILKKQGYTPIDRYPVAARWRDDIPFVEASIDGFIPYVISGEVQPPENPLTIPQFCLRFNDIDNVGLTGAHYTGFIMIGQHAFVEPKNYNTDQYLKDLMQWFEKGLGLNRDKITIHELAWAGSGNFGPCIEFNAGGLELANQVYMQFRQTPTGYEELNLKVLDMGLGYERNSWISQGTPTSYDVTFPTVIKRLSHITGFKPDNDMVKKFLPYSALLKADEVENINKVWIKIAKDMKVDVLELRKSILPLSAIYSIAEHSRSLLVSITDGALPSNVGGGYNLRVILRRALTLIDKYKWDISLSELCDLHAQYLKPLFPELRGNLNEVAEIIDIEKNKYEVTKQKSQEIIANLVSKNISEEQLIKLYDSKGIQPELIKEEAKKQNKVIKIPQDFYAKVAELHKTQKIKDEPINPPTSNIKIKKPPATEILYYEQPIINKFKAQVLNIINKRFVVLDRTAFYPESGGQEADHGLLNDSEVINVKKQGNIIIHELKEPPKFYEMEEVEGKINLVRRSQLTKHHTATHIVNAAARKVLGNHINQAGAYKSQTKARLDITHYKALTNEDLKKIEEEANKIVKKSIPIKKEPLSRNIAEKRYGMSIYQGGIVPGKELRIINITDTEVEACGGTHANNTAEVGQIKIIKSTKIQDGIVRLEYVAGEAALKQEEKEFSLLEKTASILGVSKEEVPSRCEDLFEKWKIARKAVKKGKGINIKDLELKDPIKEELSDEELLEKAAEVFSSQEDHLPKIAERFINELNKFKEELKK